MFICVIIKKNQNYILLIISFQKKTWFFLLIVLNSDLPIPKLLKITNEAELLYTEYGYTYLFNITS